MRTLGFCSAAGFAALGAAIGLPLRLGDTAEAVVSLSLALLFLFTQAVRALMRSDIKALLKQRAEESLEGDSGRSSGRTVIIHGSGHTIINADVVHYEASSSAAGDTGLQSDNVTPIRQKSAAR